MNRYMRLMLCMLLTIMIIFSHATYPCAYASGELIIYGDSAITQSGYTTKLFTRFNGEIVSPLWSVAEGGDIAYIDSTGVVTPFKNGQVTVMAMYNGVYALHTVLIANQSAAPKTAYLSASVSSMGEIIQDKGLESEKNWHSSRSGTYPVGTEFVLTANETGGKFLYWRDGNTRRVITTDKTCRFYLGSDKSITAVFGASSEEYRFVMFVDKNGRIIKSDHKSSGNFEVPAPPSMPGCIFDGWILDGEKQPSLYTGAQIPVENVGSNRIYTASYKVAANTYNVSVTDGSGGGKYKYGELVTVKLDRSQIPDGKSFLYWTKDGVPANSSEIYTFRAGTSDTAVCAVYAEIDINENMPRITMNTPAVSASEKSAYLLSERYLPLDYEFVEAGILLSVGSSFNLSTGGITKITALSSDACGQFAAKKNINTAGVTWYAKAYMIYKKDGIMCTVYSNTVEFSIPK